MNCTIDNSHKGVLATKGNVNEIGQMVYNLHNELDESTAILRDEIEELKKSVDTINDKLNIICDWINLLQPKK